MSTQEYWPARAKNSDNTQTNNLGLSVRVDIPITKETRSWKCFNGFLHMGFSTKVRQIQAFYLFSH